MFFVVVRLPVVNVYIGAQTNTPGIGIVSGTGIHMYPVERYDALGGSLRLRCSPNILPSIQPDTLT